VTTVNVRSAAEMKQAVLQYFPSMDIVIMAAAVADYRPAQYRPQKIKKNEEPSPLALIPTEDILLSLGKAKKQQILVGFAAETADLIERACRKMQHKNLDLIVANDVSSGVFGSDSATVHILGPQRDPMVLLDSSKHRVAAKILDAALEIHLSRQKPAGSQ
jgi:phosphopantothenoylcysteine decarboxylase/phosphopantothenate--cysteine ligase